MGKYYAYIRCSSVAQTESGLGLTAQHHAAKREVGRIGGEFGTAYYGDALWPGAFVDSSQSAFRIPIFDRPAGKAMLAVLQPGDTVVMTRQDRGFRSVADFSKFVAHCRRYDIRLLCLSPQIDFTTAEGRAIANFFAVVAEFESDIKGQRVREAMAVKRAAAALGCEATTPAPGKVLSLPSSYRPLPKSTTSEVAATPGMIYTYVRCSHRESTESGLGIRHQLKACDAYAEAMAADRPELTIGDPYIDQTVSALSVRLCNRPQGSQLCKALRRGDHVVVLRPDRVFGTISDMSQQLEKWHEDGVTCHFAGSSINLGDQFGPLIVTVLVAMAQMERQLASTRNAESRAVLASRGHFAGGNAAPPFWKIVRCDHTKQLILDRRQLISFRLTQWLRSKGMTVTAALTRVEELLAARERRPPIPLSGVMRIGKWNKLPPGYKPDRRNGLYYPLWTVRRYEISIPAYDAAIAEWRNLTRKQRERIRLLREAPANTRLPRRPTATSTTEPGTAS